MDVLDIEGDFGTANHYFDEVMSGQEALPSALLDTIIQRAEQQWDTLELEQFRSKAQQATEISRNHLLAIEFY